MTDLTEDTLAPDVVVRRGKGTIIAIQPGDSDGSPHVRFVDGALWARAERSSPGLDLGHGSLRIAVRGGTVLLDAQGGAGLVIVLRGEAEVTRRDEATLTARAGEAVLFDEAGIVGEPGPVDASELANDPFVSLNLVLDSLGGVPITLDDSPLVKAHQ